MKAWQHFGNIYAQIMVHQKNNKTHTHSTKHSFLTSFISEREEQPSTEAGHQLIGCPGSTLSNHDAAHAVGGPTIICSASQGFTEVVSHVHFAQGADITYSAGPAWGEIPGKNSLCVTAVVLSNTVTARALNSHCSCKRGRRCDVNILRPLAGCSAPHTVAFGDPLGSHGL